MKKVAGITLMVALLGFNAYLWPTLIREVKADQKKEVGSVATTKQSADSTPVMDLANQGPRSANVSAYPREQPVAKSETAVASNMPSSEQKKQPATKAVQTAANKQPKKAANKPTSTSRQSDGPDVQITYTLEPSYIHYEETSITNARSSYGGGGSFNMPMKYNPYTGRIEEAVKIYQGGPPAPTLNKQDFGIPETVEPYVPPVKKDYQRLAPQSFPGR
ncbi:hypothetical protein P9578_18070 [Brevibacillus choshinensis]|uniref:hypothetical protein n=1 Tax=Brevibacillus choshinensis TaxID=54911 RepID=UPI002E1C05B6|nr:hypothetical protein [Brevibacillus choshinensis]